MSAGRGGLRSRRARQDRFWRAAREAGYAARSVYKLLELDRRHRLLRPGARVLDLGCAPGSWLQYAAGRVGPAGRLVGVDRVPPAAPPAGARVVVADLLAVGPETLRVGVDAFDLVLSDAAPDTTGDRAVDQARSEELAGKALDLAEALLGPGGALCAKVFQGPGLRALVARARGRFRAVRTARPRATRPGSREVYLVALGFGAVSPARRPGIPSPRGRPSPSRPAG